MLYPSELQAQIFKPVLHKLLVLVTVHGNRLLYGRGREITPGSSAIAPALLYYLRPCRHALRPSGHASHVQNRSRRFCRTLSFASLSLTSINL